MNFIDKSQIMQGIGPDSTAEVLEKGKAAQIGEVRTWSDGKYRKTASGWEPVREASDKSELAKEIADRQKALPKEDIGKKLERTTSIVEYRRHLIDYGTKNGDKDLVEYAKNASVSALERRMKSEKIEEQFQDKTEEVIPTNLTFREVREKLLENGFKSSKHLYANNLVEYTDSKSRTHSIYLNRNIPTQVEAWTVSTPGTIVLRGVVGDFVGGKAPMNRFRFSTASKLRKKLEDLL